jgi:thioredoxin 1
MGLFDRKEKETKNDKDSRGYIQKIVDETNFEIATEKNVDSLTAEGKTLLILMADWCGPCRLQIGGIVNMAKDGWFRENDVKPIYVDTDNNEKTVMKYGVMSIPTVIMVENGNMLQQIVGSLPKEVLKSKLKTAYNI